MPCLKDLGVASIPWSPLGAGVLCRPISTQKEELSTRGEWIASNISQAEIQVGRLVVQTGSCGDILIRDFAAGGNED